jgi:predicted DNA-binding protein
MTLSVRIPDKVEQELAEYCVKHRLTKSEAVKQALEKLLDESGTPPNAYKASAKYRGHDKRPGDIARHTKRLLHEHFRNRGSLG